MTWETLEPSPTTLCVTYTYIYCRYNKRVGYGTNLFQWPLTVLQLKNPNGSMSGQSNFNGLQAWQAIFFFQVNKDNLRVRYPVLIFLLINMLKWMQWTIVLSRKEQPVTLIWASEKSISSPTDDTRQCSRANSTSLKVMHGEPRQGG